MFQSHRVLTKVAKNARGYKVIIKIKYKNKKILQKISNGDIILFSLGCSIRCIWWYWTTISIVIKARSKSY
jgi:hypothetical protein